MADTDLALVKQTQALISSEQVAASLAKVAPKHLSSERFLRICCSAVSRTPKLAQCTRESLLSCLLDLSHYGLEPDGRRAYLIPYGDQCTLVLDYKGLIELVMRNGDVSHIHADLVCENDTFDYDMGQVTTHKPCFREPRGDWYAAYAMIRRKDGTEKFEVMTKEEIYAIRDQSAAWKAFIKYKKRGPWNDFEGEMAKKTAFRRLTKWVVLSPEVRDAIDRDDTDQFRNNQVAAMLQPTQAPAQEPVSQSAALAAQLRVEQDDEAPDEATDDYAEVGDDNEHATEPGDLQDSYARRTKATRTTGGLDRLKAEVMGDERLDGEVKLELAVGIQNRRAELTSPADTEAAGNKELFS